MLVFAIGCFGDPVNCVSILLLRDLLTICSKQFCGLRCSFVCATLANALHLLLFMYLQIPIPLVARLFRVTFERAVSRTLLFLLGFYWIPEVTVKKHAVRVE